MANSKLEHTFFHIPVSLSDNITRMRSNSPIPTDISRWMKEKKLSYDDAKNYIKNTEIKTASAIEILFFNWINKTLNHSRDRIKRQKKVASEYVDNRFKKSHEKTNL